MKIATILVVTLLVGGGGTAVAVATVGNVDWDQWHLFGNHNEDTKRSIAAIEFSVIHTDPEYNSEDGMYYAVTKLQAYGVSGKMILLTYDETGHNDTTFKQTDDGIVVSTTNTNNENIPVATGLFRGAHLETMTIKTHESLSDPTYHAELCNKYGISVDKILGYRHYMGEDGPEGIALYWSDNGQEKILEYDFKFKMVDKTVTAAVISDNTILEVQHIDPTVDQSLDSIYNMEIVLNRVFGGDFIRFIE